MEQVVVVVPIYTLHLSEAENISLIQMYKILGKYPICYVAPNKLKKELKESTLWVEYFNDNHFKNVLSYSKFCLSSIFYKRFTKYQYMLIYQTDAFVFYDKLKEFCNLDYDYIGAPWTYFIAKYDCGIVNARVGNGGLSLRNISSALRILKHRDKILSSYHNVERLLRGEDVFWAYVSTLPDENFHIPNAYVARRFAMTGYNEREMKHLTFAKLPFGCHEWYKMQVYNRWRKWIVAMGYDSLPKPFQKKPSETLRYKRIIYAYNYLNFRFNRQINHILDDRIIFKLSTWFNIYRGGYMLIKYKLIIRSAKMHLIHFES